MVCGKQQLVPQPTRPVSKASIAIVGTLPRHTNLRMYLQPIQLLQTVGHGLHTLTHHRYVLLTEDLVEHVQQRSFAGCTSMGTQPMHHVSNCAKPGRSKSRSHQLSAMRWSTWIGGGGQMAKVRCIYMTMFIHCVCLVLALEPDMTCAKWISHLDACS